MAKLGSLEAIEMLRTEVTQIESRLNVLRQDQPIEEPQMPQGQMQGQPQGQPMQPQQMESEPMGQEPMGNDELTGGQSPGLTMEETP